MNSQKRVKSVKLTLTSWTVRSKTMTVFWKSSHSIKSANSSNVVRNSIRKLVMLAMPLQPLIQTLTCSRSILERSTWTKRCQSSLSKRKAWSKNSRIWMLKASFLNKTATNTWSMHRTRKSERSSLTRNCRSVHSSRPSQSSRAKKSTRRSKDFKCFTKISKSHSTRKWSRKRLSRSSVKLRSS